MGDLSAYLIIYMQLILQMIHLGKEEPVMKWIMEGFEECEGVSTEFSEIHTFITQKFGEQNARNHLKPEELLHLIQGKWKTVKVEGEASVKLMYPLVIWLMLLSIVQCCIISKHEYCCHQAKYSFMPYYGLFLT